MLVPGKQTSESGYHDLLLVAGEAHDQVNYWGIQVIHCGPVISDWFCGSAQPVCDLPHHQYTPLLLLLPLLLLPG